MIYTETLSQPIQSLSSIAIVHTEIVSDSPNNSCEKMTSIHDILDDSSDLTNDKIDLLQTCLLEVELFDHPNEVYFWDIFYFCLPDLKFFREKNPIY